MERLTERKYGEIVSSKRERTQIHCSNFCNNCSQGTGNCDYVREMVEKLADYEDAEEQGLLAKVVYGEWIDHGTLNDYPEKGMNNYHLLVCSECGCCHRTRLQDNIGKPFNANFCPNCGAKMQKLAELKGE